MSLSITLLIQLATGLGMWQLEPPKASTSQAPILLVNTYVNNKKHKRRIRAKNITLTSRTQAFAVRDSAGLLVLPRIAKTDTLDLIITFGHHSACMNQIPGWRLQPGATVSIGQLHDFTKVVSIAKQHEMLPTAADYVEMSNRYAVAPEGSVMDIPDITRFRCVDYITLVGFEQDTQLTSWRGKLK